MVRNCPSLVLGISLAFAARSSAWAAEPSPSAPAAQPPADQASVPARPPGDLQGDPARAERARDSAAATRPGLPAEPAYAPSLAIPLERARLYYEGGQYAECARILTAVLEPPPSATTGLTSTARTYLAACLLASGREQQARDQFRQAILADRLMAAPDPVSFPPHLLDLYVEERTALMDTLRRQQEDELRRARQLSRERAERQGARVAELERLASTEVVVERGSVWMAWLPLGVGQFQNGDTALGWAFLATELALGATAVTATSLELRFHSQADGGRGGIEPGPLNDNVRLARRVGTLAWTSLVAVVMAGGVQARLSFERERLVRRRHRPLPPHLRSPQPSPRPRTEVEALGLPGGAWLGVTRRF